MTNEAHEGLSGGETAAKRRVALDARLAEIVVRPLARTPVTPNMLTIAGMMIGLWAAWLFATGVPSATYWAGLLFILAVFMDHVDGAHARSTGRTSRFGHYLDHLGAATTYSAAFAGIGFGLAGGGLGDGAIGLGIAAAFAVPAIFGVRIWLEQRYGSETVDQTSRGGFEIEDTLYVIGPIAWLDGLEPFLIAAGIGTPLFLIWVVWDALRIHRARGGERSI